MAQNALWIPFALVTFIGNYNISPPPEVTKGQLISTCPEGFCCHGQTIPVDGVCLPLHQGLMKRCWITAQCQAARSACRDSRGRYLFSLPENKWQEFKRGNGSQDLSPGKCECMERLVTRSVAESQELICTDRNIGSECKSHFECFTRVRFAKCSQRRCQCPTDLVYEPVTDECIPAVKEMDCENDSCHKWLDLTLGRLSFFGFSVCLAIVLLTLVISINRDSFFRWVYALLLKSMTAVVNWNSGRKSSPVLREEDSLPPSYEEAVAAQKPLIKITVAK